jgi:hypothetical protein
MARATSPQLRRFIDDSAAAPEQQTDRARASSTP